MRVSTIHRKRYVQILLTLVMGGLLTLGDTAYARKLKFGPYAVPITQKTNFLRDTLAPDYWRMSQFYIAQQTSSACTLASTVMTLNFLIGVPKYADQTLITQPALLESVFTGEWAQRVAEGGDGLRFDELVDMINKSLSYYKLDNQYKLEAIHIDPVFNPFSVAELKEILVRNERSSNDMILVYFNQGVLTSDWDGPHVSPIGAYDYSTGQVLMMDVDREWYPPYWSPVEKLLEAMRRPAPADQGILEGQTGGLLWLKKIR